MIEDREGLAGILERARLQAWCEGFNAGQDAARDNVYWRRWGRFIRNRFRHPEWYRDFPWWRWWPYRR